MTNYTNNIPKSTPCFRKKVGHFYFCDNFANSGPIFIIFPLLNSEGILGGS